MYSCWGWVFLLLRTNKHLWVWGYPMFPVCCAELLWVFFSAVCVDEKWLFFSPKIFFTFHKCPLRSFLRFLLPMENGQGMRKKWDRWFLISSDIGFNFYYKKEDGGKCREGKERKPFLLLFHLSSVLEKLVSAFLLIFLSIPVFLVFLSCSLHPPRLLLSREHK